MDKANFKVRFGALDRSKAVAVSAMLLLAVYANAQGGSDSEPFTMDDLAVVDKTNGVRVYIEQPVEEVRSILGEPTKKELFPNESDSRWNIHVLYYPGIRVSYPKDSKALT